MPDGVIVSALSGVDDNAAKLIDRLTGVIVRKPVAVPVWPGGPKDGDGGAGAEIHRCGGVSGVALGQRMNASSEEGSESPAFSTRTTARQPPEHSGLSVWRPGPKPGPESRLIAANP
jgi:hypothetical protein